MREKKVNKNHKQRQKHFNALVAENQLNYSLDIERKSEKDEK